MGISNLHRGTKTTKDQSVGAITHQSKIIRFSFFTHKRILIALVLGAVGSGGMLLHVLNVLAIHPVIAVAAPMAMSEIPQKPAAKGDRLSPVLKPAKPMPVSKVIESHSDGSAEQFAYYHVKFARNGTPNVAGKNSARTPLLYGEPTRITKDPFEAILPASSSQTQVKAQTRTSASSAHNARRGPIRGTPINVSTATMEPPPAIEEVVAFPKRDENIAELLAGVKVAIADMGAFDVALDKRVLKPSDRVELLLRKSSAKHTDKQLVMARISGEDNSPLVLARSDTGQVQRVNDTKLYDRLADEADIVNDRTRMLPFATAAPASPKVMQYPKNMNVPVDVAAQLDKLAKSNGIERAGSPSQWQPLDLLFRTNAQGRSELVTATVQTGKKDEEFYRYRMSPRQAPEFFDEEGRSASKLLMKKPVLNGRLGDGFAWRIHPILKRRLHHNGVDYAAPFGSPIVAAGDGQVVLISWQRGYGKFVRIRHDKGYFTTYAHISSTPPSLKVGQHVAQGQVIAYVGSTGLSTGPHLYYELRIDDKYFDPTSTDLPAGTNLQGKEMDDFRKQIKHVDSIRHYIDERLPGSPSCQPAFCDGRPS